MGKKVLAVLLAVVLAAGMTACRGGGKESAPEPEKEKHEPNGYRVYLTTTDLDGNVIQNHVLAAEYEDLFTERTLKEYYMDTNELESLVRWYYDESGETLLKRVRWTADEAYLTQSDEFDSKGRKIRESSKQEHEEAPIQQSPVLPEEYEEYMTSYSVINSFWGYYLELEDVKELKTEYTYQGDTEKLAGMKTVTENDDLIATVELGEGEIILSLKFSDLTARYEEVYHPGEHIGTWELYRKDMWSDNADWELCLTGEKEYNESGLCMLETVYVNSENGTREKSEEKTYTHDTEGRLTKVTVDEYNWGEKVPYSAETYTYYNSGAKATALWEYMGEDVTLETVKEEEYDETGETVVEREYSKGRISKEILTEYVEEPGIAGRVRKSTWNTYTNGILDQTDEWYEVSMFNGIEEDEWVTYRSVSVKGKYKTETNESTFDSEGHLVKVNTGEFSSLEYDTRGRLVKQEWVAGIGENGESEKLELVYEYWEGEAPQK